MVPPTVRRQASPVKTGVANQRQRATFRQNPGAFSVDSTAHPPFRALSPNTLGMDFFVGDIHGHFQRLADVLADVGFCPTRDRLIATGDLLDRGDDSDVASDWIEQPFFHTVRGNHEDLYLMWRAKRHNREEQREFEEETYFRNGGSWVHQMSEAEHRRLEAHVAKLPYFLAVPSMDGRTVGVVHAELPDGTSWPSLVAAFPSEKLLETMMWGRKRLKYARYTERGLEPGDLTAPLDNNSIPGLDAIVCGHVVVSEVRNLGNILYLDTGGWRQKGRFSVMRLTDVLDRVAVPA